MEKSCTAANLPVSGSIVTMARRLWRFYQQSTVTNVVVPENADGSLIPRLRPLPSGPSTSSATVTSRTSVNIIPDQDDGESNLVTEPGLQSAFDERDLAIDFDTLRDYGDNALPGGLISELFTSASGAIVPPHSREPVMATANHSLQVPEIINVGPSAIDDTPDLPGVWDNDCVARTVQFSNLADNNDSITVRPLSASSFQPPTLPPARYLGGGYAAPQRAL